MTEIHYFGYPNKNLKQPKPSSDYLKQYRIDNRAEILAQVKAYRDRPENKLKMQAYQKARNERLKESVASKKN